jgi:dUTPase
MPTQLNYIRLSHCPEKQLTKPGHPSDAGWDIYLAEDHLVLPYSQIPFDQEKHQYQFNLAKTGVILASEIESYWYAIYARSSLIKRGVGLANSVGVIDPTYSGELLLTLYSYHQPILLKAGTAVAQLVVHQNIPVELQEIEKDLRETVRGGFGSTDKPKSNFTSH